MSSNGCEWFAGQIVRSTAGNDTGRYYIILQVMGKRCLLSDGRHRKVAAPTAKNIKHLTDSGKAVDPTECNTDRKIRQALTALQYSGNDAFSE